jgi:peptidoglycan hydrolase CwlO-like protein
MKKIILVSSLCIIIVITLFGSVSCGGTTGVEQEVYDALKAQLTAAQAEITDLKAKLSAAVTPIIPSTDPGMQALKDEVAALKAKVTELGNQITELNKQKDGLTKEKAALEAKYAELTGKYSELEKKLALTALPETVTIEEIENAILALMNQERVKAGVGEFILGEHLHDQARVNSRKMADEKKVIYDTAVFYQETLWAAGYTTVESIARGALLIWKLDTYDFEKGTLSTIHKYGAVGAYKSGGIVYITFYAASFR